MPKAILVSYCHAQGKWVWNRLVLCLKAAGTQVLIDRRRFTAGKALPRIGHVLICWCSLRNTSRARTACMNEAGNTLRSSIREG